MSRRADSVGVRASALATVYWAWTLYAAIYSLLAAAGSEDPPLTEQLVRVLYVFAAGWCIATVFLVAIARAWKTGSLAGIWIAQLVVTLVAMTLALRTEIDFTQLIVTGAIAQVLGLYALLALSATALRPARYGGRLLACVIGTAAWFASALGVNDTVHEPFSRDALEIALASVCWGLATALLLALVLRAPIIVLLAILGLQAASAVAGWLHEAIGSTSRFAFLALALGALAVAAAAPRQPRAELGSDARPGSPGRA